ncbi:hypothetical protein [Diadegma fenestrale ichnovirus]|nr:hypothetical protein [Diadegma fenestrale ichnovirus]
MQSLRGYCGKLQNALGSWGASEAVIAVLSLDARCNAKKHSAAAPHAWTQQHDASVTMLVYISIMIIITISVVIRNHSSHLQITTLSFLLKLINKIIFTTVTKNVFVFIIFH